MYVAKDLGEAKHQSFKVCIFRIDKEKEEQVSEYERSAYTRQLHFSRFNKTERILLFIRLTTRK